jgi:hypothetical protein
MVTATHQPGINRHPKTSTPGLVNLLLIFANIGLELPTRHFLPAILGFKATTHQFDSPIRSFE